MSLIIVDASSLLQSLGAPARDGDEIPLYGFRSLGAPAIVFGRSRHSVWALPPSWARALLNGDDLYLYAHVWWVVSIIRHSLFYTQPRDRIHGFDSAETGSGIVEAGCCDTSQHR